MTTDRKQIALDNKHSACNCAQAVVCAFADKIGKDEEFCRNVANSFGAGMGTMEGTCGALVGAGIVLGLAEKRGMNRIMTKFQQRNGATQCKMLKGVGTGRVLRPCDDCVSDAVEFLEDELNG